MSQHSTIENYVSHSVKYETSNSIKRLSTDIFEIIIVTFESLSRIFIRKDDAGCINKNDDDSL